MKEEVPTFSHFLFWYIFLINGTMKEIKLTQGKVALVDDEDYNYLNQWKWYALKRKGRRYDRWYAARISSERNHIYMHRIVNNTPDGLFTDHINGNGLDNQKHNIRSCTTRQNAYNRRPYGKSKYLGVAYIHDKYIKAQISINGVSVALGVFKTEEEAARAYDIKAIEIYGEFANLNFK